MLCITVYNYETRWVENDASARPTNLTSASCDLDVVTPRLTVCHCSADHFAARSIYLFVKHRVDKIGNERTDGRTDGRTYRSKTLCVWSVRLAEGPHNRH